MNLQMLPWQAWLYLAGLSGKLGLDAAGSLAHAAGCASCQEQLARITGRPLAAAGRHHLAHAA